MVIIKFRQVRDPILSYDPHCHHSKILVEPPCYQESDINIEYGNYDVLPPSKYRRKAYLRVRFYVPDYIPQFAPMFLALPVC